MESLTQGLIETSNAIEAEVLAKSRQFKSDLDAKQWLHINREEYIQRAKYSGLGECQLVVAFYSSRIFDGEV